MCEEFPALGEGQSLHARFYRKPERKPPIEIDSH
jgi:hypothetical protein